MYDHFPFDWIVWMKEKYLYFVSAHFREGVFLWTWMEDVHLDVEVNLEPEAAPLCISFLYTWFFGLMQIETINGYKCNRMLMLDLHMGLWICFTFDSAWLRKRITLKHTFNNSWIILQNDEPAVFNIKKKWMSLIFRRWKWCITIFTRSLTLVL